MLSNLQREMMELSMDTLSANLDDGGFNTSCDFRNYDYPTVELTVGNVFVTVCQTEDSSFQLDTYDGNQNPRHQLVLDGEDYDKLVAVVNMLSQVAAASK